MTPILAGESAYSGQEITWEQMMASQLDLMLKTFDDDLRREASPLPVPGEYKLLGICLTQVGTVWQRFVWLAHWCLRPASSSGTSASRAGQGARPTWVSCCCSNYLSEAHTKLQVYLVPALYTALLNGVRYLAGDAVCYSRNQASGIEQVLRPERALRPTKSGLKFNS